MNSSVTSEEIKEQHAYVFVMYKGQVLAMREEGETIKLNLPGGLVEGMSFRAARHNCLMQTGLRVVLDDNTESFVDDNAVIYYTVLEGRQDPESVFMRETNPRPLWVNARELAPCWQAAVSHFEDQFEVDFDAIPTEEDTEMTPMIYPDPIWQLV